MKHIGLYLLQGLSPSPQVELKFHSQSEDPVNGNDFVQKSFGGKPGISRRRHKHFKCFLPQWTQFPKHHLATPTQIGKYIPYLSICFRFQRRQYSWAGTFCVTSKQLNSKGITQTNRELLTRRKDIGFLLTAFAVTFTPFLFIFDTRKQAKQS